MHPFIELVVQKYESCLEFHDAKTATLIIELIEQPRNLREITLDFACLENDDDVVLAVMQAHTVGRLSDVDNRKYFKALRAGLKDDGMVLKVRPPHIIELDCDITLGALGDHEDWSSADDDLDVLLFTIMFPVLFVAVSVQDLNYEWLATKSIQKKQKTLQKDPSR